MGMIFLRRWGLGLMIALAVGALQAAPTPDKDKPPRRSAKSRKVQKPASQLIAKPSPPKVIPRVLDRATPENTRIEVSLGKQRAFLIVEEEIAIDAPISSGKRSGMTPTGTFTILEKDADHRSSLYGDFVSRKSGEVIRRGVSAKIDSAPSGAAFRGAPMRWFLRITWEGVGMHTGILPGYPASHGCIRLPDDIARIFYDRTRIGTEVRVSE